MSGAAFGVLGLLNYFLAGTDRTDSRGVVHRHPYLPSWVFVVAVSLALIAACFLAWRDIKKERDELRAAMTPTLDLIPAPSHPHMRHDPDGTFQLSAFFGRVGVVNRTGRVLKGVRVRLLACEPAEPTKVLLGLPLVIFGHPEAEIDIAPSTEPHIFFNVVNRQVGDDGWRVMYVDAGTISYDTSPLLGERVLTLVAHADEGTDTTRRFVIRLRDDGSIDFEPIDDGVVATDAVD